MEQEQHFCFCGALTYDTYYKSSNDQGRQTHQAPTIKHRHGCYKELMKACPKCDARFSTCKKHPELKFQPWTLEERMGRCCKAKMWVYRCKKCEAKGSHHSTVLCPGCKAPFANKGPKWYLELKKKCRWAKTRGNCYKKMDKEIKSLLSLGESPEAILAQIKNLVGMPKTPKASKPCKLKAVKLEPESTAKSEDKLKLMAAVKMESGFKCSPPKSKPDLEDLTLLSNELGLVSVQHPSESDLPDLENPSLFNVFDSKPEFDFSQLADFYFPEDQEMKNNRKRKRADQKHDQKNEQYQLYAPFSLLCEEQLAVVL